MIDDFKNDVNAALDWRFENEPLSSWFLFIGAASLFLIAWSGVISTSLRGVRSITDAVKESV